MNGLIIGRKDSMNWKAKCQELAEENRRLREELAKKEVSVPVQAVERKPRQQRKRK